MKKIYVMLLMMVMCFSLFACGKKEQGLKPEENQEAIDITTENWQTYFEVKDEVAVYETTDKDGKKSVESAYVDKFIYLKEEYKEKFAAADITFTYKLGKQEVKTLTYTIADGSYTLTDSSVTFAADKETEKLPTVKVTDVKTQMHINAYADYEEEEEELGFFESLSLLFGGEQKKEETKEKTTYVCDTLLRPELEFTSVEGKIIVNK